MIEGMITGRAKGVDVAAREGGSKWVWPASILLAPLMEGQAGKIRDENETLPGMVRCLLSHAPV
jgi:hypothetical protein